MRLFSPIWFLIALLLSTSACEYYTKNKVISIKGSETMAPLMKVITEKYNSKQSTKVIFKIEGGGTKAGLDALINEEVDIAMTSKAFNAKDYNEELLEGKTLDKKDIALDELLIVVNSSNKVSKLTVDQLQKIFSGELRNWSEIGGNKEQIKPITRKYGSGSRSYFESKIMNGKPFVAGIDSMLGVKEILESIENNPNTIAYIGAGNYSKKIKMLEISTDGKSFYYPSEANVRSKNYPFSIPLSVYYFKDNDNERLSLFIKYIGGKSVRYKIKEMGLIPIINED